MTAIRQRWHRSAAVATGAAALLGTGMFVASPASAHTPGWEADCYTTSIHLENYNDQVTNTVKITAGDKTLVDEKFGRAFDKKVDLPKHTSPLDLHLVIKAGDDDKFSRDEHKQSPVCEESPSPSPSPSDSSEAPAPSEKPSSAAPAPNGGGDDLAETGASSATPMIAGAAGVVLVAGAGLVVVARKRRSAQD
ncbi:LPXTG cell wall anchor domain-containing protein [Streptomyces sp. HNM0575]|uniref:LPXTG cell wall anchor domain-containing protein n=1 Tax=Streptomyces sp. HNM0575 TaxID=2716338 RepID=UPI00145DEDC9|nr:LPXTG cell wall anchor domain-containing protein [Streptomyces sp. HNM0575]NLU73070.1 LPXTG cell wall anchor domain-containing protein [Streptomyces sp. HNM0575]